MGIEVNSSKQHAAKVLGIAYLSTFVIVVYANFGIYDPLHVAGDAGETARRIADNKHLFRFGIVLDLIYAIGFTVLISSLYTILIDTNRRIALVATLWQLVYVVAWVVITLKFYDALRLASRVKYLSVFGDEHLYSLARLFLSGRFDRYYGVLLFYALGSTLFNYLWYKSGYVPRWLALYGMIACAWCAICAMAYLIYPDLEKILHLWLYDTPMALFDITLSVWLLTQGLKNVN